MHIHEWQIGRSVVQSILVDQDNLIIQRTAISGSSWIFEKKGPLSFWLKKCIIGSWTLKRFAVCKKVLEIQTCRNLFHIGIQPFNLDIKAFSNRLSYSKHVWCLKCFKSFSVQKGIFGLSCFLPSSCMDISNRLRDNKQIERCLKY